MVLLSEGVALPSDEPTEARLNRLAQLAAEAGVTVHTVDVTGVTGVDAFSKAALRDGLTAVAERMGGIYAGLDNNLILPLRRVASMERGYYLLSFAGQHVREGTQPALPQAETSRRPARSAKERNPPFRKLSVRARPDGLTVRTRAGFFGAR